jgi:hypothetical protein
MKHDLAALTNWKYKQLRNSPPFLRLITPDTEDGRHAQGGRLLFQTAFQVNECKKFSAGTEQSCVRRS